MAKKKETGLSIKGHSIVALVILLVGLPIATAYVMDVSRWFEGDTQKLHGPFPSGPLNGEDYTADWNNQTGSGIECPDGTAFRWLDSGWGSFAVPAFGNASTYGTPHCGWSGVFDAGGVADGTYGHIYTPGNSTPQTKKMQADDMILVGMTPCSIDAGSGPTSNSALGFVNCGYSDYKLELPSNAFPTNTAMIGFHFAVLGSMIYGLIPCADNWQVSYDWELSIDGTVFADGSEKHWALEGCSLNAYGGPTNGRAYVQIDTDLNVVQVAKYAELIKSAGQNPVFAMRVFNFYDESLSQTLKCEGWDMGCELALKWGKHTAFDGITTNTAPIPGGYNDHHCSGNTILYTAATYASTDCAMMVGLVVDTADFSGNDGFTLGLFTWGLGATFMIVAIASTRLWDPFKEKTKEVIVNG